MADSHTHTLGLVMAAPFVDTDGTRQGEVMGFAFILASETQSGKFSANEEMKKLVNLDFQPIIVVRVDPSNVLGGYSFFACEGVSDSYLDDIKQFAIMVVDDKLKDMGEWLHKNRGNKTEAFQIADR
jgi:hypothetical protein